MNYDDLAFVNRQLADMLASGIPLEGSLRQLCAEMKPGKLRDELTQLESDLAKGIPLNEALERRKLPQFYVQMVQVGVKSNDLPGILALVADYYQKAALIWMRLKGLMVYPVIVLFVAMVFSVGATVMIRYIANAVWTDLAAAPLPAITSVSLILPPVIMTLVFLAALLMLAVSPWRNWARWKLPGFKEAALSQFAAAMELMLRRGCDLAQAINLMQALDKESPVGAELSQWQQRLASGHGKFAQFAAPGPVFTPLFIWLVQSAGEDLAGGFKRAAEIFHARAEHRIEMILYALLPVMVLLLGIMIVGQVFPLMNTFRLFMDYLG